MKTIVWDIDDVLNDFMRAWLDNHWLQYHPECLLKYEELKENPPNILLEISIDEYRESIDEFRYYHGAELKPDLEILNWFSLYGNNFRHVALTAVPIELAHISASWLFKYFGTWFRSFNVVPSERRNDYSFAFDLTKKDFLQWSKNADIFIDDNSANINSVKDLGIETINISKPWNNSEISKTKLLYMLSKQ